MRELDILDILERCAFLGFFCLTVDFLVDLDILDAALFWIFSLGIDET